MADIPTSLRRPLLRPSAPTAFRDSLGSSVSQRSDQTPSSRQPLTHPQTTPTSTGFLPQAAPAYFDAQGQPTAATKMSTVGTASETESDDTRTTTIGVDNDDDMMSDANYREAKSVMSNDAMMDDDQSTNRSVGDRMSDDGNTSLVGFGEGAGSIMSGPIYQRRPIPGIVAGAGGPGPSGFGVERSRWWTKW